MSERLTTEQKQLITTYRQQFAELKSYSDEQILSIINNAASEIKLSEDEQVSILHNSAQGSTLGGLALETKLEELTKEEETQLLDILGSRIDSVTAKTEEAENKNGFLGKAWNWTKNNLLDWCTDSTNDIKKAQKEELEALKSGDIKTAFEKITGEEYNPENANKFLNNELKTKSEQALEGYEEGQKMAADFAGDMISGIAAIGIYSASLAAAPFTGGLSIAVGLADAAVVAGLIKSGIKAWDASSAKREYNTFGKDMITGGFSGLLAPFTGGVGGAVGRGVATKLGIQAMKQIGKETLEQTSKQTLKTMLTNPTGYEYIGGTAVKKTAAYAAEMAADGALAGGIDTTFREGYEEIEKDGELDVGKLGSAFVQGTVGGLVLSPVIGGGMKGAGKAFSKIKVALGGGKTIEITEAFGLGYVKPESNLERGYFTLNGKKLASNKKELLAQLEEAGVKGNDWHVESLIKKLKTEEDFNKASILLSSMRPYYAYESFEKVKTLDEAVVKSMLIKNDYYSDKAVSKIIENPLLFNIYQETNTVMGERYSIILERTIAEKLKAPEECEAYLHIIKNNKDYLRLESLYQEDFIPKNIEDANSYISILNYLGYYDYSKSIGPMKEFLSLPAETRAVLEKHLKPKERVNSYYPINIRQETFIPILKGLHDKDARASLTKLLEKVDDFKDLESIYALYLSNDFSQGIYDKEVIDRLNQILDTGAEISYHTVKYYVSKGTNIDGERVFRTEQKYFDKLINAIEDNEIQEKLGRVLTVDEANGYCYDINTDLQRGFYLDNLNNTKDLLELTTRAGYIKNEDQIQLAKFFLDKSYDFEFHEKSSRIHLYELHEILKTKEDVETFLNLARNKSNMTPEDAQLYTDILNDNVNFSKRVRLIESLPELKSAISSKDFNKFVLNYDDDIRMEMLKEINKLIKNKPQLADRLSPLLDATFYSHRKNIDENYLAMFKRNIEFLSNADDEILNMIQKETIFTTVSIKYFLEAKNLFDVEKFNKFKHLVDDDTFGWSNESLLDICMSNLSVEEINKLLIKTKNNAKITTDIVNRVNEYNKNLYSRMMSDNRFSDPWDISLILGKSCWETGDSLEALCKKQTEFYKAFCNSEELSDRFVNILSLINLENADYTIKLCKDYKKLGIPVDKLEFLIDKFNDVDPKDLAKLIKLAGKDFVDRLDSNDLAYACQLVDIYGVKNINEIPISSKNKLLKKLISFNKELFGLGDKIKKEFPLIPHDQETYCSILPAIVRSMGIETKPISSGQLLNFNNSVTNLSATLAKISDKDFANLTITQEFSREQFIRTVLDKTKNLASSEKQKVYDYFGFELSPNNINETGFSLKGYPVNLNNGEKLAQIADPNTKAIVEALRKDVVKFSEQNPIRCSNPTVEKFLNDIAEVLPEIRTQIGRTQHGTHSFDVMQHSLKVMQKISQDSGFEKLNESDKKIMMLASLMHDITKVEGISDKIHATESSFDISFIAKKFNLTKDEEIKLYTLTRHHEWLGYVNTAKTEEELTKRLQSVAYDLRHDNMFEMALMFTHADLKAVKADDSFHNSTQGASSARFKDGNRVFNKNEGAPVSHGDAAELYSARIRGYINELKLSQPLLPVTKLPKSSNIRNLIQKVYPDGTTDIKGVYVDNTGLVVIKYNEVENWQALGFPEGAVSRGYQSELDGKNINTGNIKFFVHGLDFVNQLAKFDAFNMIDSDVLLSVSYAERPESKYRFFRTQGVILDVDTKYIHGGGETDAGSGCEKFLSKFKENYIFGGYRESDRTYVSNLIKEATGMNDKEYLEFVKANENKAMHEIEPAETRKKIIDAFATINSRTRRGERAYNEMYLTNPEVMGVFAYPTHGNVGHVLDFLNGVHENVDVDKINFLKEHAIEHDLPFIVFGD